MIAPQLSHEGASNWKLANCSLLGSVWPPLRSTFIATPARCNWAALDEPALSGARPLALPDPADLFGDLAVGASVACNGEAAEADFAAGDADFLVLRRAHRFTLPNRGFVAVLRNAILASQPICCRDSTPDWLPCSRE